MITQPSPHFLAVLNQRFTLKQECNGTIDERASEVTLMASEDEMTSEATYVLNLSWLTSTTYVSLVS